MKKIISCSLLPMLLLLGGCAGSSQSSTQVYSEESRHPAPVKQATPRTSTLPTDNQDTPPAPPSPDTGYSAPGYGNTAVDTLLRQAAQARAAGEYVRAQTLAERAQALAPRDAHSYLELSRIHHARGDKQRSRQMALRGLSVVGDDPATEAALQLLSTAP